jgi:phytoene dehydrogenase-like protein
MENGAESILVIGSGPGGMGVATLLQSRGHQVTLLEKNRFYGGKCSSYTRDAFLVDSAFHIFSMGESGPHGEITRRVRGDLQWTVHNPFATARFGGLGYVKVAQSIPVWIPYSMKAYATRTMRASVFNNLRLVLKNFGIRGLIDTMIKIAMVDENFLSSMDDMTGREFLLKFTEDRQAHQLFGNLALLAFVIPYTEASAGELIWCLANAYRKHTMGVPKGGVREVCGSFMRAFLRDGGALRTGCEVNRILVEGGKARGVETSEGEEITADVVVSNAGIKRTVEMAGPENFPDEYVSYVQGLRESYAALIVKFALDRRIEAIPNYCFLNIPDIEADHMVDYVWEGGVSEDPPFCMVMPPDWDPRIAPPGKQLIIAGGMGKPEITPQNISHCEQILDKVEERVIELFPEIQGHVEWKERNHVAHIGAITGKPTGECIGLAQCVGQVGAKKPSPRTPVEDLWLVGCDAGARGVGTEQAAGSAILLSNLLT